LAVACTGWAPGVHFTLAQVQKQSPGVWRRVESQDSAGGAWPGPEPGRGLGFKAKAECFTLNCFLFLLTGCCLHPSQLTNRHSTKSEAPSTWSRQILAMSGRSASPSIDSQQNCSSEATVHLTIRDPASLTQPTPAALVCLTVLKSALCFISKTTISKLGRSPGHWSGTRKEASPCRWSLPDCAGGQYLGGLPSWETRGVVI
jgi:hypothetical protein